MKLLLGAAVGLVLALAVAIVRYGFDHWTGTGTIGFLCLFAGALATLARWAFKDAIASAIRFFVPYDQAPKKFGRDDESQK